VKPGWVALQRLVDDRVEIYFLPPEHHETLKGSLASYVKAGIPPGEAWDKARQAAWEAAAREKGAEESQA
jgi:hypothetical protein